jgi:hypothetical protein
MFSLQRVVGNSAVNGLLTVQRTPTWYRGEAAGVPRASPGGSIHDLGDGLYLTDSRAAAQGYGDLRAGKAGQGYVVGRGFDQRLLGKTLDLTADPRWAEFMSRPSPVASMGSNWRVYASRGTEQYWGTLQEFLHENKIDLADYDSVIGEDLIRNPGAKQLCIRNPAIAERIDDMLERVPEPPVKPGPTTPGTGGRGKPGEPTPGNAGEAPSMGEGPVEAIEAGEGMGIEEMALAGESAISELMGGLLFAATLELLLAFLPQEAQPADEATQDWLGDPRWSPRRQRQEAWAAVTPDIVAELIRRGVGRRPSGEFAGVVQQTKGGRVIYANILLWIVASRLREPAMPVANQDPWEKHEEMRLIGIVLSTSDLSTREPLVLSEGSFTFRMISIRIYDPNALAPELLTKQPETV